MAENGHGPTSDMPHRSRDALRPLLELACRETLRRLARNATDTEFGGNVQSVDGVVREAAARVLEDAGDDLFVAETGKPGPKQHQANQEGESSAKEVKTKPLLANIVATPWTMWREIRSSSTLPDYFRLDSYEELSSDLPSRQVSWRDSGNGSASTQVSLAEVAENATQVQEEGRRSSRTRSRSACLAESAIVMEMEEIKTPRSPVLGNKRRSATSIFLSPQNSPHAGLDHNNEPLVVRNGLTLASSTSREQFMQYTGRPRAALLVAKPGDNLIVGTLQDMAAWLSSQGLIVVLESQLYAERPELRTLIKGCRTFSAADRLERCIDLVITIGGDGTLTWAVSLFKGAMPPVVAFSAGSMGFLTPFPLDGWVRTLTSLLDLHQERLPMPLVCRMRLRVSVRRRDSCSCSGEEAAGLGADRQVLCLNEVLVHRGRSAGLAKLDVSVDGERVTLVQGDGVILATPTGSTAYSLAAGGSMVHPAVPGILLTPVSPHSLSFRPAVLPDSVVITLAVPLTARSGAALSVDGKEVTQLRLGDSVQVAMSPHPVPTICRTTETKDWFASVHEALQWNGRAEQKGPQ